MTEVYFNTSYEKRKGIVCRREPGLLICVMPDGSYTHVVLEDYKWSQIITKRKPLPNPRTHFSHTYTQYGYDGSDFIKIVDRS